MVRVWEMVEERKTNIGPKAEALRWSENHERGVDRFQGGVLLSFPGFKFLFEFDLAWVTEL